MIYSSFYSSLCSILYIEVKLSINFRIWHYQQNTEQTRISLSKVLNYDRAFIIYRLYGSLLLHLEMDCVTQVSELFQSCQWL